LDRQKVNNGFVAFSGVFLLACSGLIYIIREPSARAGVDAWSWLPDTSKFKRHETQMFGMKVAASVVAVAGTALVLISLFSL
jgi:hypothetical protein